MGSSIIIERYCNSNKVCACAADSGIIKILYKAYFFGIFTTASLWSLDLILIRLDLIKILARKIANELWNSNDYTYSRRGLYVSAHITMISYFINLAFSIHDLTVE